MDSDHTWLSYMWEVAVFGAVLLLAFGVESSFSQRQEETVPQEISNYISAHNMAAAFSTPEERLQLLKYETPEAVRESTNSQRLTDVFTQLQTVDGLEMEVDPNMPMGAGSPRKKKAQPELLEIDRVFREGDRYIVEIRAHRIDRETNFQFISSYEKNKELSIPKSAPVQLRRKVQYWIEVEGTWKKQETNKIYLGLDM